ncbi:hypothetical protein Pelo_4558 [Pelomyxa schiedti]|nr:hypothetical protein Pelo_4558 [Pelomyxa schiedti]
MHVSNHLCRMQITTEGVIKAASKTTYPGSPTYDNWSNPGQNGLRPVGDIVAYPCFGQWTGLGGPGGFQGL